MAAEEDIIPSALRIVHRDQDPIAAFSFNQVFLKPVLSVNLD